MIADEYAKALFELTTSENAERIDEELKVLCDAFAENPDVLKVLDAPNITSNDKKKMIESLSNDMDELLKRFLLVLVDNQRFDYIAKISEAFHDMVADKKRIIEVEVISRMALNETQEKSLKKALSPKLGGNEIVIKNIVDEGVIGGLKCIADGQCIDLSIKGKLSSLKESL